MNNEALEILQALEMKLGNLVIYESLLIKEADILKSMYEKSAKHIEKTEELLQKFDRDRLWFFESFDGRIKSAMETKFNDLIPPKLLDYLDAFKESGEKQ